jgi:hypothetical protein
VLRVSLLGSIILFGTCISPSVNGHEDKVTVKLKVIRIDAQGERPWRGAWVGIFPKNEGVAEGFTNQEGEIAFEFDKTELVVLRVGARTRNKELAPLSGRISQSTSYLDDRRQREVIAFVVAEPAGVTGEIFEGTDAYSVQEQMENIKHLSGGRLMDEQSRKYVQSLTAVINEVTATANSDSSEAKQHAALVRQKLIDQQQSLLQSPWRMGTVITQSPAGVVVDQVTPDGPAAKAGIRVGERINEFEGRDVTNAQQSFAWMVANSDKQDVSLLVTDANGQQRVVSVKLTR